MRTRQTLKPTTDVPVPTLLYTLYPVPPTCIGPRAPCLLRPLCFPRLVHCGAAHVTPGLIALGLRDVALSV